MDTSIKRTHLIVSIRESIHPSQSSLRQQEKPHCVIKSRNNSNNIP
jgi:hypothetical protein